MESDRWQKVLSGVEDAHALCEAEGRPCHEINTKTGAASMSVRQGTKGGRIWGVQSLGILGTSVSTGNRIKERSIKRLWLDYPNYALTFWL